MRLFISINFNNRIIDELVNLQEELRSCGVRGNFTKPENLHLTLAFIGEYSNPDDVLDVIEEADLRPMELHFDGLEHFRDMYFARIADSPALNSYVRRLRRGLSDAGIPFDKKKFRPHITLVRKLSFANGQLSGVPGEFELDINATKASLMSSTRGKNGMIYTEL